MISKFFKKEALTKEVHDWGTTASISDPQVTQGKDLVVLDVVLYPGKGHAFHHHPNQEEVIYIINGEVEQWIGQEKSILTAGDSAVIPPGVVHASFNMGKENANVLAILGPAKGESGYEVEEVFDQAPWNTLR